jgi:hypothetical protein
LSQPKQDGALVDGKSFVLNPLKCFGISRLSVSKVEVLEGSIEGKHSVITCSLTMNNLEIPTHALIDCGATGIAFMNQDFPRHHQIQLPQLMEKNEVEDIDGRPIESGDITHIAKVGMQIQEHKEQLPRFITKLGYYPIVLGIPWLRLHDVAVRFASNTVTWGSQYSITHCHDASVTVQGVTEEPLEPVYQVKEIFEPNIRPWRPFERDIVMPNGTLFFRTVKKGGFRMFKASLYNINKAIEAKDLKECPLEEIVPEQYDEFLPLFNKVLADWLPSHGPGIDHEVCLKDGETPT